jgi:hypothetical protein
MRGCAVWSGRTRRSNWRTRPLLCTLRANGQVVRPSPIQAALRRAFQGVTGRTNLTVAGRTPVGRGLGLDRTLAWRINLAVDGRTRVGCGLGLDRTLARRINLAVDGQTPLRGRVGLVRQEHEDVPLRRLRVPIHHVGEVPPEIAHTREPAA